MHAPGHLSIINASFLEKAAIGRYIFVGCVMQLALYNSTAYLLKQAAGEEIGKMEL